MLTTEQKATYENMRQTALADLDAIDREIATELTRTKQRLLELQADKATVRHIVESVSMRLGVPSPQIRDLNLVSIRQQLGEAS